MWAFTLRASFLLLAVQNPHFSLRIGDFDAVLTEFAPDLQVELRAKVGLAGMGVFDPNTQVQIDAVFGKAEDLHRGWGGLAQHPRVPARNFGHEAHGELEVAV